MDRLEQHLTNRLYRAFCPPAQELGEYHLDLLPAARRAEIGAHLDECLHCRSEVAGLSSFLSALEGDLPAAPTAPAPWRAWLARLVPELSSGPGLAPAFGLRGEAGGGRLLVYQAGDSGEITLNLEIQPDPAGPGLRSLLGLAMGAPLEAALASGEGKALLTPAGASAPLEAALDELGNFVFSGLAPGRYELALAAAAFELHVPDLSIE